MVSKEEHIVLVPPVLELTFIFLYRPFAICEKETTHEIFKLFLWHVGIKRRAEPASLKIELGQVDSMIETREVLVCEDHLHNLTTIGT